MSPGGGDREPLRAFLGSCQSGNFGRPFLRTEGERYQVPISTAQVISVVRHLEERVGELWYQRADRREQRSPGVVCEEETGGLRNMALPAL